MSANLEGRELDEACARAMGYEVAREGVLECQKLPSEKYSVVLRRYSTDAATLDEKLHWLSGHELADVTMRRGLPEEPFWALSSFVADGVGRRVEAHGADIHEATARLVVEVAKKKESQP